MKAAWSAARLGHLLVCAIVAVVHALLKIAYVLIERKEDYQELGSNYFDTRQPAKTVQNLLSRLSQLGYDVTLNPKAAEQAAKNDASKERTILEAEELTTAGRVRLPESLNTDIFRTAQGHGSILAALSIYVCI